MAKRLEGPGALGATLCVLACVAALATLLPAAMAASSPPPRPVFDGKLTTDIFNAMCTPGGNTTSQYGADLSLPIFCATFGDDYADYANFTYPAHLNVYLQTEGDEKRRKALFYPQNLLGGDCGGEGEAAPVAENPEYCTLDNLVVIPSGNFKKSVRFSIKNGGNKTVTRRKQPGSSRQVDDSLYGQIIRSNDLGDEKFSSGVSLATSSCSARCMKGYQCMPNLELAIVSQGSLGKCEACGKGSFCPEGTLHDGGLALGSARINLCPAGYFCPEPTLAFLCPPGYFCPLGSHKPFSCDGIALSNVAMAGNYCPIGSDMPFGLCPKGWYCPDASQAFRCPEGHYCEVQSLEPKPCASFSSCPEGSRRPGISYMVLIAMVSLFVGFGLMLLSIALWIRINQRKTLAEGSKAEKQASLLKAIGVKLGLCAEQMSYASNLKGFSENIMLVDIVISDLSVRMAKKGKSKLVLRGVSLAFKASSLNIIMGSSGAGKTTFLKALVGKFSENAVPSGHITFDFKNHLMKVDLLNQEAQKKGKNSRCCLVGAGSAAMAKLRARKTAVKIGVGYVAQDNIVHEILTVHENIAYSAKMRLGSEMPAHVKGAIIQDTITILGLNHIQNAKVGNPMSPSGSISGGEARRVSIGLELVACPSVLILDEPTSGLDSVAANSVMNSLSKMSDLGVTVVASLHQPRYSTFLLFDTLHLFMRGGYVVYSGPTSSALDYFQGIGFRLHSEHENPADFMLDVIAGLIDHPGKEDFDPLDLAKHWESKQPGERAGSDLTTSRLLRHKRSGSEVFPLSEEEDSLGFAAADLDQAWPSKDDGCLSTRSGKTTFRSKAGPEEAYDLFTSVKLEDERQQQKGTPGRSSRSNRSVWPTPRWLETLGEQFDQLDSKKEGYIDNEKMMTLLKSMGQKCTMEEANEIVKHFDVDGDGRIQRKDFLMRWTKNYWTREFSTALLGLFPGENEDKCIEVDALSRGSLRPSGEVFERSSASIELNPITSRTKSQASARSSSVSRKYSIQSVKSEILDLFSTGNGFVHSRGGGFFKHFFLLLQREPLKMMRRLELKVLDFGSVAIIGMGYAFVNRKMVTGNLEAVQQATNVAMQFMGVLSALWGTLFMSKDMPMIQREASEGISVPAIFLSMNLFNTAVDVTLRSLCYSLPFYYITGFNMSYGDFFLVTFGAAWSCGAIGVLTACLVDSRSAIILSVAISFLLGAVLNGVSPSIKELQEGSNPFLYWMVFPSYNRWATEVLTIKEELANRSYSFAEKVELTSFAYEPQNWVNGVIFLYASGAALRLLSFAFFYRKALQ